MVMFLTLLSVQPADAFVEHALPWMGRKTVEMGRYGASELMRNKKTTKESCKLWN